MMDVPNKKWQYPLKKSPGSRRRRRGKIISISSFFDGKGDKSHRTEDVITIYTGLRRWWLDANWRTWLILALLIGIILGLTIGRSGRG